MAVLDLFDLSGQTALVTGGYRGLGRAFATALAEAGADVVITGRDGPAAAAGAGEIAAATGRTVAAVQADVAARPDVERLSARSSIGSAGSTWW